MAILNYLTVPTKDSITTVELDKTELLTLSELDAYWSTSANISKVGILLISIEGQQKKYLNFDFTQPTPQTNLYFSNKARDDFEVRGILLTDFDGGNFIISRASASAGTLAELTSADIVLTVQDLLISSQQAYVKASNTGANDEFGASNAVSGDGNTVVIGAYNEDSNATGINGNQADNSANNSGAVYVFTRTGSTWTQQAYIKASNAEADDTFGKSVALSYDGNTLAVGAQQESSNATGINGNQANNSSFASGAVYVFTRTGSTWTQQAYIKASDTTSNAFFGAYATSNKTLALSQDGNTLAVGAPGNSFAVYVFTRTGSTWSQEQKLTASNAALTDFFGRCLDISADGLTLAVGAPSEASNATGINGNQANNSAANAGAVYVFVKSAGVWSQEAYIKASNTAADDSFGRSVALSQDGNTLAVGATGEDSNATGIDGNQADNSALGSGAVYVFTRTGSTWSQQAYIKASNAEAGDAFGSSVALSYSGNTLIVGAISEDSNAIGFNGNQANNSATAGAGAVYVFTRTGSTWTQQAYVKPSNTQTATPMQFGGFISISALGETVVAGARLEASSSTGINSTPTYGMSSYGSAYIFVG